MLVRIFHLRHLRCLTMNTSRQLARSQSTTPTSDTDATTRNRFIYRNEFESRHIGVNTQSRDLMLNAIKADSIEDLVAKTIPHNIRQNRPLNLSEPMTEEEFLKYAKGIASQNQIFRSYIGMGYSNCHIPTVIQRNVFENPGWVTQYTPYQAELSQGRLENLFNFQTMICDLTGLDIANASLLDEATAAAEAMALCTRSNKRTKFLISDKVHPQSIDLIQTRAAPLGIQVVVQKLDEMDFSKGDISGFLFQYPDTDGSIINLENVIQKAKSAKTIVVCAADLLSLCLLKSPHEIGADIALGNSQRFGVPLGFGGPHAAFFAAKDSFKREIPGRIIGISIDSNKKKAYRLSLQTREQHIRQGKATSNICTAQALLANMSAFYAIYHGPEGLRKKALHAHSVTLVLAEGLKGTGNLVVTGKFFDTIKIKPKMSIEEVRKRSEAKSINFRYFDDQQHIGISLDETVTPQDINDILEALGSTETFTSVTDRLNFDESPLNIVNDPEVKRQSTYLQHSIFNSCHSETDLVRYMKTLENKDVSLVHSMIPLGSCTMKLNATTELMPCSWPEFNAIHPFVPRNQVKGYHAMFDELCKDLCEITGYDKISLQPNSGSQGEYAGLRAIMSYLSSKGESERRVCLIPTSAHGTNPASAAMAGMKIISVNVNKNGEIDMNHLNEMANKYKQNLACAMVTYPSTYGVFDTKIVEICQMIHELGGQIYLDGANLNAQVGLCRPGDYGSDVSHLNLHKTFCIPHGGGGPGMGPIGVKKHLAPFLPSHSVVDIEGVDRTTSFGSCSAAPYGSSSILPISWAYIKMMGGKGLTKATQMAILNANYMKSRLESAYHVNYTGDKGMVAHEFIINADFKATANIEAIDIAKRLQDYGFHAPTVSWPVHGALMVEPTESESIEELDRFCDSLLMIREEIKKIEMGQWDKENNPVKNAPHIQEVCISSSWDRPYTRETAAYPIKHLKPETKIWPTCGRVNDPYGDKHLVVKL